MQEMDDLLKNNQIKLQGIIVSDITFSHEVYGESFYNFFVEIVRLSDSSDTLPVTISDRLIDKDLLKQGEFVYITGQIRSYNNYIEEERRNRLVLTVFVREIELLPENIPNNNPNDITLNGFICKKPVYRSTPFGREIADILIAVNRAYNKSDYIPCIAWGRNARYASQLAVGNNITVNGRMQSRIYQKKLEDGSVLERVAYEVSISKVELLEMPTENEEPIIQEEVIVNEEPIVKEEVIANEESIVKEEIDNISEE